jgi:uncharacterized membrane protein
VEVGDAPHVVGLGTWDVLYDAFVLGTHYRRARAGIRWLISQGKESRSDSALEILRQRYARGEINKEEFEAKKKDLGG